MQIKEYKNDAMSDVMITRVVERFRALADEPRIRLLLRLKRGGAGVSELAADLGIAQPSVSKHLAILRQVGLLDVERRGTSAIYSVKDKSIFDLCSIVCAGVTEFAREQHEALGFATTKRTKGGAK